MKDIEVDAQGRQRCWNCGGMNFTQQRTLRSKVAFGVGALVTKKKLRCVRCDEYNDVGDAKAYRGPASRKYRGEWEAEQARSSAAATPQAAPVPPPPAPAPAPAAGISVADELQKLAGLRDGGVLSEDEFQAQKARLLGIPAGQISSSSTAPGAAAPETGRFDVVLVSPGPQKIAVIKELRDLAPLSLRAAKDVVDHAPSIILTAVTQEQAERAKAQLERVGASVDLR